MRALYDSLCKGMGKDHNGALVYAIESRVDKALERFSDLVFCSAGALTDSVACAGVDASVVSGCAPFCAVSVVGCVAGILVWFVGTDGLGWCAVTVVVEVSMTAELEAWCTRHECQTTSTKDN